MKNLLTSFRVLTLLSLTTGHCLAGLVAYYPFDSDLTDSSGNGNHGTQVDITGPGNAGVDTTTGGNPFGAGFYSQGNQQDRISIPAHTFAGTDSWSFATWAKQDAANSNGMLAGNMADTQGFLWIYNGNSFRYRNNGSGTNYDVTLPSATTNWNHYAFTKDGSTGILSVYQNGTLVASPNVGTTIAFTINALAHGYSGNQFGMVGDLDEVYVYDHAISPAKVAELYAGVPDTIPPTLASADIVDNRSGGPVAPGSLVTYTVTFNEDINHSTVDASDFGDAGGDVSLTFGSITETSPGVFSVKVTPTSVGTLDLQVNAGASILDAAGNALNTAVTIVDDTGIVVEADTTPPTLAGGDFSDDQGGGPVVQGTVVTFTITFSEDMDHTTVDAADFGNQGSAGFTIGAIVEISPGVFTVEVTTTSSGTLQLKVLAGAELKDSSGNPLDTTGDIVSDGIIDVQEGLNPAGVKLLRVVLLGGQSNADGRAAPSGLPTSPVNLQEPQGDVDYTPGRGADVLTTLRPGLSSTSGFGPEITLGRHLADELGDGTTTRVAVVKYGQGGTNLHSQWKAGGDGTTTNDGNVYVTFQQRVNSGLAALAAAYPNATIELVGMVWFQGESDADLTNSVTYEANLINFIADVRATYGAKLRLVVIRLSSGQTALDATGLANVRAAQTNVAAADPLTGLVVTDSYSEDNLHFTAAGQQDIGNASALQLLNLYPYLSGPVFSAQPGGNFGLTVEDVFDGFLYTLEQNPGLGDGNWTPLETVAPSGGSVSFTHTPGVGTSRSFFRVGRSLAP